MSRAKSYFNKHAHNHAYHNNPAVYLSIISHLRKLRNDRQFKILDVGCGDGSFIKSANLAGFDAYYIGTDVSVGMISIARRSLDNQKIDFFVADGLKLPLGETKFDIIHIDSVLHHLIRKTRSESIHLVAQMIKDLVNRLSDNGILIVEEVYYMSYMIPSVTSSIIFYALKLLNFMHLDIHKIVKDFELGLEVNFLCDKEIQKLLRPYGTVNVIEKVPWRVPRLYRYFFLKDFGHISYSVTKTRLRE